MNVDSPVFGRITIGSNRVSLGRGAISLLMVRAAEQIRKVRHRPDIVIQIELSPTKLPESSTFDKLAIYEQEMALQITTDLDAESPFPGISLARVNEAMSSPEYAVYERMCDPIKRLGLMHSDIEDAKLRYSMRFPDCVEHFPKWID